MTPHTYTRRILRACYRACGLCYCGEPLPDSHPEYVMCDACYARSTQSNARLRKQDPSYRQRYYRANPEKWRPASRS